MDTVTIREELIMSAINDYLLTCDAYDVVWREFASWRDYCQSLFVSETHKRTFLLLVAEAL